MPGTLLAYDAAFPRPHDTSRTGPIVNRPSEAELRAHSQLYPGPYRLLPIARHTPVETYCREIASACQAMKPVDRLILFGHGRVVRARIGSGYGPVTTGIIIGGQDISIDNAWRLSGAAPHLNADGLAELWVCEAAGVGESGGVSGSRLCSAIARSLGVTLKAAEQTQYYDTVNQQETQDGGWQSTARFLPWEGPVVYYAPSGARLRAGPAVVRGG